MRRGDLFIKDVQLYVYTGHTTQGFVSGVGPILVSRLAGLDLSAIKPEAEPKYYAHEHGAGKEPPRLGHPLQNQNNHRGDNEQAYGMLRVQTPTIAPGRAYLSWVRDGIARRRSPRPSLLLDSLSIACILHAVTLEAATIGLRQRLLKRFSLAHRSPWRASGGAILRLTEEGETKARLALNWAVCRHSRA